MGFDAFEHFDYEIHGSFFLICLLDKYLAHRMICDKKIEVQRWSFPRASKGVQKGNEGFYFREILLALFSQLKALLFSLGRRIRGKLVTRISEETG